MKQLSDQEKLEALLKKLEVYEAKVDFRLKHFRGVAHESASGELASSELKVLQDYVAGLKQEVETLKAKIGPKVWLVEHLICNEEVVGSTPTGSTLIRREAVNRTLKFENFKKKVAPNRP